MGLTANNSIKSFFAKLKMEFIPLLAVESHALSNPNGKKNREGGESNTTIRGISHYNLPLGINWKTPLIIDANKNINFVKIILNLNQELTYSWN